MGIYSNASTQNDSTLFHAMLSYLNLVITNTGSDEIEVPVQQYNNSTEKIKDVIIARNDKPLVGVRITVSPSSIAKETVQVPLTEQEIADATKPDKSDDATDRLKKATFPRTKGVEKRTYKESTWSIHIRTKADHGPTLTEFSGTPFDSAEIEKAFMTIIEIIKP
ncbi:hypothetical protein CCP1ISM_470004 [Azospirillaceae bacterium]